MKRRLQQALLVEGKYDAARLANLVEGIILTTDGFAVFKDRAMQDLLKRTARACEGSESRSRQLSQCD